MIDRMLQYGFTAEHEWIGRTSPEAAPMGITDYAQSAMGDMVYVQLPRVGQQLAVGEQICDIESTKSVSDLYAPVSGEVVAVNYELDDHPELINSSPYDLGWIAKLRVTN